MVFQNYALFPHMTVYENLAFPLRVRKVSKDDIDKKVDKALSMVSLTGFENRMPGQLSGGQQQRVAVARALVNNPELILADEPTGNLDPETSEKIMHLLKSVANEEKTVIMATHDFDIINKYPARVKCATLSWHALMAAIEGKKEASTE